jgi:ABC-type antimicrobial peptide transport system permease subunit
MQASTLNHVVTLMLATSGLYGLLSYAVTRRGSEISVRMALGAERRVIVFMVLRQAATLVVIGMVIGISATIMGIRLTSDMLFGLSPYDPVTFTVAATILAIITSIAAFIPSRRASRLDPTHALRSE